MSEKCVVAHISHDNDTELLYQSQRVGCGTVSVADGRVGEPCTASRNDDYLYSNNDICVITII